MDANTSATSGTARAPFRNSGRRSLLKRVHPPRPAIWPAADDYARGTGRGRPVHSPLGSAVTVPAFSQAPELRALRRATVRVAPQGECASSPASRRIHAACRLRCRVDDHANDDPSGDGKCLDDRARSAARREMLRAGWTPPVARRLGRQPLREWWQRIGEDLSRLLEPRAGSAWRTSRNHRGGLRGRPPGDGCRQSRPTSSAPGPADVGNDRRARARRVLALGSLLSTSTPGSLMTCAWARRMMLP